MTYFDDSVRIDYQKESTVPFELDGEEYVIPTSPSAVVTDAGTAKIDLEGNVMREGDGVTDYVALAELRLDLREKYFSRLAIDDYNIGGTVSNFTALCGIFSDVPSSDVEMTAKFDDTAFKFISFSYENDIGATVRITFEFSA